MASYVHLKTNVGYLGTFYSNRNLNNNIKTYFIAATCVDTLGAFEEHPTHYVSYKCYIYNDAIVVRI